MLEKQNILANKMMVNKVQRFTKVENKLGQNCQLFVKN